MRAAILGIGIGTAILLGGSSQARAGDNYGHHHHSGYGGAYYGGYAGYAQTPSIGFSATYAPRYGYGASLGTYYGVPAYRPVPAHGGYGPYYQPYGYGHHHGHR